VRKVILVVIGLTLLAGLWAVPAGAASQLTVALHTDETTITPYSYVRGYPGYNLLLFVYDTLFMINKDAVPEPWLVEKFTLSPDGKVYTLDLHKGVKWHDGKPFTAEDVIFTFDYVKKYPHSRWTSPLTVVEKYEAKGTHQVVITLKKSSAGFVFQPLADLPILPKHIWNDVTTPKTFAGKIGTGPFKLVEYKPDQFYKFEANKTYFKGKPSVDQLTMPIIKDTTAIFTALKAGQIDGTSKELSSELVKDFRAVPGLKVETGPGFTTSMLLLNIQKPHLGNKSFRQAISLAIDRKNLVDTLYLGLGVEGSAAFTHPALPWFDPSAKVVTDRAKSKEILDGLNYKDVNKDGYRETPDGKPLSFTMLTPSNDPIRVRTAEIIAAWLKEVGIKIKVEAIDRASVDAQVWPDFDITKPRTYEIAVWGWTAPMQSWPGRMQDLFHSDPTLGNCNLSGYKNTAVDALLNEIYVSADAAKRNSLAGQVQKIVADEVPFATLMYPDGVYVYKAAAHSGWVYVKGQGIFNKLSFVGTGTGGYTTRRAGPSPVVWGVIAAAAVVAAFFIVRGRRRK
jgi:peptide/nickel transport system substrate-binding protein